MCILYLFCQSPNHWLVRRLALKHWRQTPTMGKWVTVTVGNCEPLRGLASDCVALQTGGGILQCDSLSNCLFGWNSLYHQLWLSLFPYFCSSPGNLCVKSVTSPLIPATKEHMPGRLNPHRLGSHAAKLFLTVWKIPMVCFLTVNLEAINIRSRLGNLLHLR